MHYTVQSGDTLWLIAQRFRSDYRAIAQANSIEEPYHVHPGQMLHIPRRHRLIGFIPDYAAAEGIADALASPEPFNEVIYTFLRVQSDGTVQAGAVDRALQVLRARRTRVLAGVTNLLESAYSAEAASAALMAEDSRSHLAAAIVEAVTTCCLDGACLDFQRIGPGHWDALNNLACELRSRFSRLSPYYTIALVFPCDWLDTGLDLTQMSEYVDLMIMEAYEKGAGAIEGPPTTILWLEENAKAAVNRIGTSKLTVALGVYGLDWTEGANPAYLTAEAAERISRETNALIERSQDDGTPGFSYYDASGRVHRVWYEDFMSVAMKIDLLDRMGIRKIALWRLGTIPRNLLSSALRMGM
jgi:spore germination protein